MIARPLSIRAAIPEGRKDGLDVLRPRPVASVAAGGGFSSEPARLREKFMLVRRALLAALCAPTALGWAGQSRLPIIGSAPDFELVDQRRRPLSLIDLRGKVLVIGFIFTTCSDTCPIVTAKLAEIQRGLGADFGVRVRFLSISVDPLTDTPERLRTYAAKFGADVPGWSFLTGAPSQIDELVHRFGAYARRAESGAVDHLNLTSLVDARARLRVQYLGYRFKVGEMLTDLRALLRE
jgi:protein SCO1/2